MDLTEHFKCMAITTFIGYKALLNNETPVACIIKDIKTNKIISIGYNYTNKSLNGTQHAEFIALQRFKNKNINYNDLVLYVTVEPCIMCASYLRQLRIRKVYFGCGNDRFGGNGTILSIHSDNLLNSTYQSICGICRTEAIQLLRNFYIQENESAPTPKLKKNKDIESKLFPPNQFTITKEEFIYNLGEERLRIFEDGSLELTPRLNEGYNVKDFLKLEELKRIPFLEQELGDITQQQIDSFGSLFYSIEGDGSINYEMVVLKYTT
ncbi:unnamed protein product [Candida verbasci]|uniref:CMP/dCMP-type deaminase domain-containing protein n=1 Tax=Candida verbasci TaxID=1227364 RepID=A0A9W4TUD3_9ASCO|nr:unnamed protein product [Candida verbasci]